MDEPPDLGVRDDVSKKLLSRARKMRTQPSDAERVLWKHLRGRRLNGFKFHRQVVIEPYIVDFACYEAKIIIEADGGQHAEQAEYDAQRSKALEIRGYRVLRFWNNEILVELESVLEQIRRELILSPHPNPLPEGEGV